MFIESFWAGDDLCSREYIFVDKHEGLIKERMIKRLKQGTSSNDMINFR